MHTALVLLIGVSVSLIGAASHRSASRRSAGLPERQLQYRRLDSLTAMWPMF